MILYEFRCTKCNEEFDAPTQSDTSHCGAIAKRKFSIGGIAFKGKGFYSTDK